MTNGERSWVALCVVIGCLATWSVYSRKASAAYDVPERIFSAHGCDVYRFVDTTSRPAPIVVFFATSTGSAPGYACTLAVAP